MAVFENGKAEDLLAFLKNFKKEIDGTVNMSVIGRIEYLCMLLHWKSLHIFDKIASPNNGATNAHLKTINEGLLGYSLPINSLPKQNTSMRLAMRKPCIIPMK